MCVYHSNTCCHNSCKFKLFFFLLKILKHLLLVILAVLQNCMLCYSVFILSCLISLLIQKGVGCNNNSSNDIKHWQIKPYSLRCLFCNSDLPLVQHFARIVLLLMYEGTSFLMYTILFFYMLYYISIYWIVC